jgi:hypothetical protein
MKLPDYKVTYILLDISDVIPGVHCKKFVERSFGLRCTITLEGNMLHASLPEIDVWGVLLISASGAS